MQMQDTYTSRLIDSNPITNNNTICVGRNAEWMIVPSPPYNWLSINSINNPTHATCLLEWEKRKNSLFRNYLNEIPFFTDDLKIVLTGKSLKFVNKISSVFMTIHPWLRYPHNIPYSVVLFGRCFNTFSNSVIYWFSAPLCLETMFQRWAPRGRKIWKFLQSSMLY